jgi:serine/threonine-protein kinase
VQPGEVLAGKYVVDHVLGQGGMGVVVAGRHIQLGNRVAIKFLLPAAAQHPEATARFLREARAAVQIQSEHVARVSDVGTLDNGAPYMVMEFLNGSDLGQVLAARGSPFAIDEAVGYLLQACEAIAEAHALGIVHRDLKPANLFLTRRADGSALVKVLDFGISKVMAGHGADTSITATATVMGSPAYMSPEQVRSSKNVDTRTDIWSLGMILYEFLAGGPAFVADTTSGLLAQIVADPPMPLSSKRPDVPPRLESVVMHCLEKDPARRIGNVAEFAQALLPFSPASQVSVDRIRRVLHGSAALSPMPDVRATRSAADRTVTVDGWGSTSPERGRGRRKWLLAAVSLGTLGGLSAAYYALRSPDVAPKNAKPADSRSAAAPSVAPAETRSPIFDPAPAVIPTAEARDVPAPDPLFKSSGPGRAPSGTPRSAGAKPVRGGATPAGAPTASTKTNKDLFDDIN